MYNDTTQAELDQVLVKAVNAFHQYKTFSLAQRANFMRTIAQEIEALGDELIQTAMAETNLPEARLVGERARTMFQLTSYAAAAEQGNWLEASIHTAVPDKTPPKPDLRKMLVPLGPVVVFGASNFPFAYSTAGGDTACAFAAGCPVIVKAHPAHAQTSTLMANAILTAAKKCNMPDGIFSHVYGAGFEVGEYLAKHDAVKAIGFTGSFGGGKALFDWANQRKNPIPVFAEMGSVNPIFILPEKVELESESLAKQLAGSITLGMGQFCTNPGLLITINSEGLERFIQHLKREIKSVSPAKMLHQGIATNYAEKLTKALAQKGVQLISQTDEEIEEGKGLITLATTNGKTFLENPILHQEVFGPYSLIVQCADEKEFLEVAKALEGQLTATLMATPNDIRAHQDLLNYIQDICGRFILNNVPTGVDVSLPMHHGGPFPASTDSRFTSVGADGIKRFARPLSYQNWDDEFLPDELKNTNPLQIWRTVNNELTREQIS
ncbi:aldehyde dehydrogenase (NADP(+)) [Pedobacter boryungensis]|uniref:Aldehyde dehydrogenase (NADP(+)) n=1 Tax=Pedobacter boryungensis TaxID=869962 RepID=A0ABX2DAN0_9SPHI|nr:aldehyde dehydrogenase (NADP(+)) [Pedobacter boryungensis]NQX30366.1 aldehyde dehydrogenase (NADP(+)) [Pedobacter boryungensis]